MVMSTIGIAFVPTEITQLLRARDWVTERLPLLVIQQY